MQENVNEQQEIDSTDIVINNESKSVAKNLVEEGEILLPDDVMALVAAIKAGSEKKILACIKSGVNLNTLISEHMAIGFNSGSVKSKQKLSTPLALAVLQLDYDIVKILLMNNADPNMLGSDNRSVIEVLMLSIANIIINQILHRPLERNVRLAIKVKTTMNEKIIKTAHTILDLLLSYGLKPNIEWTEFFNQGIQELTQTSRDEEKNIISRNAASKNLDALLTYYKVKGIKKAYLSKAGHAMIWLKNRNATRSNPLKDYIKSVSNINELTVLASREIQSEKHKFTTEVINAMLKLPGWPVVLTDLVVQYSASSFASKVAEQRLKDNKIIKFWKCEPGLSLTLESDTRKKEQEFQYNLYMA